MPTAERKIHDALTQDQYDEWGFVIYRTDYSPGSDGLWDHFKDLVTTNAHRQIAESDTPDIAHSLTWTFFDNASAFEGASKAQLRDHFNDWVQRNWRIEQPRAPTEMAMMKGPRYRYFISVDRGVLESMPETIQDDDEAEDALMHTSYVEFVDAEWRPLVEWCPYGVRPQDTAFEAIEGCTEWDVGWMRIHAYLVGPAGFDFFQSEEVMWHHEYRRPPEVIWY